MVTSIHEAPQASAKAAEPMLPPLATLAPPVYHQVPLLILCGSIGSAAFALACRASWIEVTSSGLTAGAGMLFYYFVVIPFGVGSIRDHSLIAFNSISFT